MALKKSNAQSRKGHTAAESKKRLVEAGLDLFARYSFDGVSTRTIAQRAQVNLAAIQYYFGGKEGLYLAVARHITDTMSRWSVPILSKIEEAYSTGTQGKDSAFVLLCELLDHIIKYALVPPESTRWMGIFMREQLEPSDAFDILYEGVMQPLNRALRVLIATMLNLGPDEEETKLRAYAVMGQILAFHIARAEITRTMAWDDYNSNELEMVRRVILEQVRALLGMPKDILDEYFQSIEPPDYAAARTARSSAL